MPLGPRIRANNVLGTIDDNPLATGAVVMNSVLLANLPTVSSAHAVITLDPLRQNGNPEIVIVTAHTVSATSATITRGAYGTTARTHPQGTVWIHSPMNEDVIPILTSGTRPADPYRGETIFETDTNRYVGRSTADIWQQSGLFFDPPACRLTKSNTQSLTANTPAIILWDGETFDTDNMHSTVSLTSRITFNTPGIYLITCNFRMAGEPTLTWAQCTFLLNGTTSISAGSSDRNANNFQPAQTFTTTYRASVSDFVEVQAFQNNTNVAAMNFLGNDGNGASFFSATWIGRGN